MLRHIFIKALFIDIKMILTPIHLPFNLLKKKQNECICQMTFFLFLKLEMGNFQKKVHTKLLHWVVK